MMVALLGVGHWHAGMHAEAVRKAGGTVCAVWDPTHETADRFSDAEGGAAIADLDAALAMKPDLAVVMGHPNAVPALVGDVLARRVPMVLEKPAAPTTAALRAIEARRDGGFVAIPFPHRLGPTMRETAGAPVAHASFRLVNGPPQRYRDDGVPWVLDPAVSGGGALRNLGIHGVDSALAIAEGELRIVSSSIGRRLHDDEAVEDHALVTFEDEAGGLFTVEAGYTAPCLGPGGDFEWRVATRDAYAVDRDGEAYMLTSQGRRSLDPLPLSVRYTAFMRDTFERLHAGRAPSVGLEDYVRAMALIDAAYERAVA